jgi:hypothetical protein
LSPIPILESGLDVELLAGSDEVPDDIAFLPRHEVCFTP